MASGAEFPTCLTPVQVTGWIVFEEFYDTLDQLDGDRVFYKRTGCGLEMWHL